MAEKPGRHTSNVEPWKTAISDADEVGLRYRGHDVARLMSEASFADAVFLLHQSRLPTEGERRILDAILIAAADHGPGSPSAAAARIVASGNRQAPEAAVGAGVLAMGDAHAGAGQACMTLIAAAVSRARQHSLSLADVARDTVEESRRTKVRLPGMGHRVHVVDPRTAVLFGQARQFGIAGDGVAFMTELEGAVRALVRPLPINIDGALAAVLYDMGLPALFGKFIFIIGRVAGLTAQVTEELTREKPMRVRLPVDYDGPPPRS